MSLIKSNKQKYSLEDFEKGLMLLGLISPRDEHELAELGAIDKYEKEASKRRQELHFKRVVLAAEIVSKLYNEPTFGRIKFQKLVYLCEHASEMSLTHRYAKQAAGPFDNKFMHSIHKEFKKLKWFDVKTIKSEKFSRSIYVPLENSNGYLKYYDGYFIQFNEQIQFVIELFRHKRTDDTELAATVFACYLELKKQEVNITSKALFKLFYDWSDKKKRFSETQVLDSLYWLSYNKLISEVSL